MDCHLVHPELCEELKKLEDSAEYKNVEDPLRLGFTPVTLADQLGISNFQPKTPFFRLPLKPREIESNPLTFSQASLTALLLAVSFRLFRPSPSFRPARKLREGKAVMADNVLGAVIKSDGSFVRVVTGEDGQYRVETVSVNEVEETESEWKGLRLW